MFGQGIVIAQDTLSYVPLVKEGATWSILDITINNQDPANTTIDTTTLTYIIQGDTSIHNLNYKKLWQTNDSLFSSLAAFSYSGALRDENRRVLFLEQGEEIVDTLYDFNLLPGDTIERFSDDINRPFSLYLDKIDTFLLLSNEPRRSFHFKLRDNLAGYSVEVGTWIEGMGDLELGPFPLFCFFSFLPRCLDKLLCYTVELGNLQYQRPGVNTCFFPTITALPKQLVPTSHLKIYPNPANHMLYLQQLDARLHAGRIELFDAFGRRQLVEQFLPGQYKKRISLSGIPQGLYYLKCSNQRYYLTQLILITSP